MILYIIFLIGLGTLAYFGADMYLPALPLLETYFNTSKATVGFTFSIYMFGITIGQLFYGTLSDHLGRKKTLIIGLSLFVLATIGCILSTRVEMLIFWRFLQALGACASMVVWQAIVIDKFDPKARHKLFSIVFPMLSLSPALAPTIGGAIIILFPWQAIFITLCLIALILLICVVFFFAETSIVQNVPIKYQDIKQKYAVLLRSPLYMGYVCTLGLTSSAYFCYLTASPFILTQMGHTPTFIGLSYIPQTLAFMLGGFFSKRLIERKGEKIIWPCLGIFTGLSLILFALTVFIPLQFAAQLIVPFTFMALLSGVLYTSGMSLALNFFPHLAGTAAGLAGSLQAFTAFLFTGIMAALLFMGALGMASLIVINAVCALICFRVLVKSHAV